MRTFKIKVYFLKDILIQPEIILVKNDYNSVEFDFEFDIEEGKKVFKLKKPDGNAWIKDIVDNKIVLVDYDEEGNVIPIINKVDEYNFEIVCYDENSKITATQKGKFNARDEVVNIDEDELSTDSRIPLLDSLINETIEASKEASEKGDYAKSQGDYAKEQAESVISANNQATEIINEFKSDVDNYTTNFNENADSKFEEYNDNHQTKMSDYNENATSKKNEYNTNHTNKLKTYNDNDKDKTTAYNQNHDSKIESYNTNHDNKLETYNTNDIEKTNSYNSNHTSKMNAYNDNHTEKLGIYNSNHEEKMNSYNENHDIKMNEFNNEVDDIKSDLEDCYKNQIVGQVSGTSIYVDDSADARMRTLDIDGALKQETTTGKNLFDCQDVRGNLSSIISIDNDNFITINYDNSENTNFKYINYFTNKSNRLEVNRKYAIFLEIKNVSGNGSICIVSSDQDSNKGQFKTGKSYVFSALNNNQVYKFVGTTFESFETSVSMLRTYVAFDSNQSGSITFRISVLENTTITPENFVYEQYTGGIASPNPDYPQEIEVLEAPNLLPYPYTETTKTVNGITFTDNGDGTITLDGTATNDANFKLYGSNDINNQLLILGDYISGGISNNIKIKVINKDINGYTVLSTSTGNQEKIDLSIYKNGYIEILVNKNTICDNIVVKPMLTKNDKIKNYIPHSCIEAKVINRNLIKNELTSKTLNGVTATVNEDKSVSVKGTVEKSFTLYLFKNKQSFLKKNTEYTLSSKCTLSKGTYFRIQNSNNTDYFYGVGLKDEASSASLTFTHNKDLNDKIDCILWFGSYSVGQNVDFTLYPQLEEGNKETEYTPYQEDSITINLQGNFVAKINDEIKDTLRIENGHAILTKRIGKYVVDNSTTVHSTITSPVKDKTNFYTIELKNFKALSNYSVQIASNIFTGDTASKLWATDEVNYCSLNVNSAVQIRVDKSIDTTEKMKELLLEKGAYFYGVLAEPYNVDLGSIKLPKTFKGVSNIFLNANLETNFRVDYVKDTQLVIDDLQSQINNINTLLSTTETSALLLDNLQSDLESEVI